MLTPAWPLWDPPSRLEVAPALSALTNPAATPAAVTDHLALLATACATAAASGQAGTYAGCLTLLARLATAGAPLLTAAVAGTATTAQIAGLLNAEQAALAVARLLDHLARSETRLARICAARWATWAHRLHADLCLTRREHAHEVTLVRDLMTVSGTAPVQIDAAAATAVATLSRDPLLTSSALDLPALAAALAAGVTVA